jgi:hypothetical protein
MKFSYILAFQNLPAGVDAKPKLTQTNTIDLDDSNSVLTNIVAAAG